jgi:adenylate cyclase class IV
MLEVERKYKVRKRDFATIQAELFKRLLPAIPLLQLDTYLISEDPALTIRVRSEQSRDKTIYLLTEKRKCKVGQNTNEENESEINQARYETLLSQKLAKAHNVTLAVKKRRIEFYYSQDGFVVTICLDEVWGPKGLHLGYMVELETMVEKVSSVESAQEALQRLAREVLPSTRSREKRGYRTMLLDALARKARAKRAR